MNRLIVSLALSPALCLSFVPVAWAVLPASGGAPLYRSGEVLVKYRADGKTAAAAAMRGAYGLQARESLFGGRMELLQLPSVMDVPAAVAMLTSDPLVEYAEPNFIRRRSVVIPNDPLFGQQWGLSNTGQPNFVSGGPAGTPGGDLNAINAWDLDNDGVADHTGRGAVIVAVVDDAVETTHPDLAANIVAGFNFVNNNNNPNPAAADETHGTSVAGCVAAVGNNGLGVSGAAWNERIMPLKFGFDTASEVRALQFAQANGARVINASFGGPTYSRAEFDAISALNDAGIVLVAAAGNENSNNDFSGAAYPANYRLPNVIAVAATNRQDGIASFSSYGSVTVPVAAAGLQIVTTAVNGGYTNSISGTSFSSPYTAGVAALIRDYFPAASVREVKARLIEGSVTGLDPSSPAALRTAGGRVNAATSLRLGNQPSLVIQPAQTSTYQIDLGSNGGVTTVPVYSPVVIEDGGNGALDPGETTNMRITLENLWLGATNVRATLSASGGVTVNSGTVNYNNISSQTGVAALFNVTVPATIGNHQYINFTLDITADGGYRATRRFIQEVARLQDNVPVTQPIQTDIYDEFHTWHVDVGTLPAGSNRLVFTTTGASNDIDIIVRYREAAQYEISLSADESEDSAFRYYNVPASQVGGSTGGNETVTINNPQPGTYFVTVVNFDQRPNASYTLRAALNNTPPVPIDNGPASDGGGGAAAPVLLAGLALAAALRRRRSRRAAA